MKTLSRPMFRRGGSTGGITSNLKKPRQGFSVAGTVQAPDFRQIMSQYMQAPEEPKGLTSSDNPLMLDLLLLAPWLRHK